MRTRTAFLQQWSWGRSKQPASGKHPREAVWEPQAETTRAKGQFPGRLPVPLGPSPCWPRMLPPKEGWKGWCLPDGNRKPAAGRDAPREPPPLPEEQYKCFPRLSVSCRSARPLAHCLPSLRAAWLERKATSLLPSCCPCPQERPALTRRPASDWVGELHS